jgi:hypothetical protein
MQRTNTLSNFNPLVGKNKNVFFLTLSPGLSRSHCPRLGHPARVSGQGPRSTQLRKEEAERRWAHDQAGVFGRRLHFPDYDLNK